MVCLSIPRSNLETFLRSEEMQCTTIRIAAVSHMLPQFLFFMYLRSINTINNTSCFCYNSRILPSQPLAGRRTLNRARGGVDEQQLLIHSLSPSAKTPPGYFCRRSNPPRRVVRHPQLFALLILHPSIMWGGRGALISNRSDLLSVVRKDTI